MFFLFLKHFCVRMCLCHTQVIDLCCCFVLLREEPSEFILFILTLIAANAFFFFCVFYFWSLSCKPQMYLITVCLDFWL